MQTMVIETERMHPLLMDLSAGRWDTLFEYLGVLFLLTALVLGFSLLYSFWWHWLRHENEDPVHRIGSTFLAAVVGTFRAFLDGLIEICRLPMGFRRIWAVAALSFKESIRRRILFVFVMFLIPFLFAGWYLPKGKEGELVFLVAFVNNAMTWLLLPLVVFMASMSFPGDIQNRSIQTVVTKPINRLELLVGRILGFLAIFTIVLMVMGTVSLFFLKEQISLEVRQKQWTARVPVYANGKPAQGIPPLRFVSDGVFRTKGTNIGDEWDYRSHIEGETDDSAHWYFVFDPELFDPQRFADYGFTVPVQLTFNIFKTTKGDPTRKEKASSGVWCQLVFKDPTISDQTKQEVFHTTFRVDEHRLTELEDVPAKIFGSGELEVIARCFSRNQFLGMARYDLFFLAGQRDFSANFLKGLLGIWLKIVLLTCVAASASTVLDGFVTVLLSTTVYILGFYYDFMMKVIHGTVLSSKSPESFGPLESLIRLITHNNQDLEPTTLAIRIALGIDEIAIAILGVISKVIPNLTTVDTVSYVAWGFDIPAWEIVGSSISVLGYVVPVVLVGHFLFRAREIAS